MAKVLAQDLSGDCPVFCSPAVRAQETIKRTNAELVFELSWELDEALYTFDSEEVSKWLLKIPDSIDSLMIVAHNPALTDLVNALSDEYLENIPTCGFVKLEINVKHWGDIKKYQESAAARIVRFSCPKDLKK